MKDHQEEKAKENKNIKRYSMSKEEKAHIMNILSVLEIMAVQRQGLHDSLNVDLIGVRKRLGVDDVKLPENMERVVTFDKATFEIVVEDREKPKIDPKEELRKAEEQLEKKMEGKN